MVKLIWIFVVIGNKYIFDIKLKENGFCVRDELLKFYSLYYLVNIMVLIILGRGIVLLYMRLGIIIVNNCEILCMIFNFYFWNM